MTGPRALGARLAWPTAALAAGLAVAAAFASVPFDEGFAAYYGWRIAAGEWPYRDFWAYYAPGQFFALGALNRLFSPWGALLAWDAVVRIALVSLLYLWARVLGAGRRAWIAWCFGAVALVSAGMRGYALFPAMLLGLISLLLMARWEGRPWRLLLAGSAAGLASFFRQDVGAYLALLALAWTTQMGWRALGLWSFAAALSAGAFWAPVLQQAGLETVVAQVVDFPRQWLHAGYALPYPRLVPPFSGGLRAFAHGAHVWVQFYGSALLGLALAVQAWRQGSKERLLLLGFSALLFSQALNRPDGIHRLPAWLILLPLLASAPWKMRGGTRIIAALLVLHWGLEPLYRFANGVRAASRVDDRDGQRAMAAELRARSSEDEPIYVVNGSMSRALVNDMELYVRARRRAGSRIVEFHPGLSTTEAVQRGIVADLESRGVRWVVRCHRFDGIREPNLSSVAGSGHFDAWLEANFSARLRHGEYVLWERRP